MAFQLDARIARNMIADPVMAAKVLMGVDYDVFQRARMRTWWFTPTVMDHSGVSTGKSEMAFVWVFLRLMLLPLASLNKPRIVSVYYQAQGTAEEVFLPKIEDYVKRSRIFENQIKIQHGRKFYKELKNVIRIEMRDGGWCELPAGDFMKDSANQASKRVNDTLIDEGAMMDQMGKGLNKQILQRNTRENMNPYHPVHCNHTVFLGHAEDPKHPYYQRYVNIRRHIRRRGSQDHALLTSSYRDFRGVYRERYAIDTARKAREQYLTDLDEAEHAQVYEGLWKHGSRGLYVKGMRDGICRQDVVPLSRRVDGETIFCLGWDSAPGMKAGADLNAGVVTAATRYDAVPPGMEGPGWLRLEEELWFFRGVYGILVHGATVDQRAGLIHRLDRLFGFSLMVLDSQGGGAEVYRKLRESKQLIDNVWEDGVTGVCTPSDGAAWPVARPIVHFYDRGDPMFRREFGKKYVADQTGPIDYGHREMLTMMRRGEFAWPLGMDLRGAAALAELTPEQRMIHGQVDRILAQFGNIGVKVDRTGQPVLSEKGFQKFSNVGKKDGAMAAMYSALGLRARLRPVAGYEEDDGDVMGVY